MNVEWEAGLEWVAYKGWLTQPDAGVPSRAMDPGFQERRGWIYSLLCQNEIKVRLRKIVGFEEDSEERPYNVDIVEPTEGRGLFAFSLVAPVKHDPMSLVQAIETWIRHNHRNLPMPVIVLDFK